MRGRGGAGICPVRPGEVEEHPEAATSPESLGQQLPASITPFSFFLFFFALCFGLCMSLGVAMTELMVREREGWAGATDAMLLGPTLGPCRQAHTHAHARTNTLSCAATKRVGERCPVTVSTR